MSKEKGGEETAVLQHLIAEVMAGPTLPPTLSPAQRQAICATFFLLYEDAALSVERFVTYTLGRLLSQLSRQTAQRPVMVAGQVRGRINWPRTIKARYTQDYDPTRYVCREVQRLYDTPENQLLKFVVERIYACLLLVPPVVRRGACYYPAGGWGQGRVLATGTRLGRMETAVNRLRYHVHYRQIETPSAVVTTHIRAAETSRQEEYADVVAVYRQYKQLVAQEQSTALAAAGRNVLPLPDRAAENGRFWLQIGAAVVGGSFAGWWED